MHTPWDGCAARLAPAAAAAANPRRADGFNLDWNRTSLERVFYYALSAGAAPTDPAHWSDDRTQWVLTQQHWDGGGPSKVCLKQPTATSPATHPTSPLRPFPLSLVSSLQAGLMLTLRSESLYCCRWASPPPLLPTPPPPCLPLSSHTPASPARADASLAGRVRSMPKHLRSRRC